MSEDSTNPESQQNNTGGETGNADSQDGGQEAVNAAEAQKAGEESTQKPSVEGAPESYGEFKVPEGQAIDEGQKQAFTTLAKDLNLTQDSAQKLVDYGAELVDKVVSDQKAQWDSVVDEWATQTKSDKELGGQNLTETQERAKRAFKDLFGAETETGDQFFKLVEDLGLGNHPVFLKGLVKYDRLTGEDKTEEGQPGQGSERSAAEVLYPNQGKN